MEADTNLLSTILNIFTGTPLWVWAVFLILFCIGKRAMKERVIWLPTPFLIPILLCALHCKGILHESSSMTYYAAAIVLGCVLAYILTLKTHIEILRESYSIKIPGSYRPMALLMLIFVIQYVFGFLHHAHPEVAERYMHIEASLNGLFTGYFLGKAVCYLHRFFKPNAA